MLMVYRHVGVCVIVSYPECGGRERKCRYYYRCQGVTLSVTERYQPQHGISRALSYQRELRYSQILGGAGRAATNAIRLVNSENSNVQQEFSSNTLTIDARDEYWDRYNSTENKSCHKELGTLVYNSTDINMAKY